ncbi:acyl-CoA dehydrogenase [Rhodobacterales bacterium HKCCE2091]|nr:acyl-CoA dehydrogenase [Rhodobacterales bacterium HKCCE2091]
MPSAAPEGDRLLAALEATPGWHRLLELRPEIDRDVAAGVLDAAARLADDVLAPLDRPADIEGCRVEAGRVRTPSGYAAAWSAMAEGGWLGVDLPEERGGSGLPIAIQACTEVLFDRACPAFGMAGGASRSAAILLQEHAPDDVAEDWVPAIVSGERTATICISEPDAGSDVGRIRTRAERAGDVWRITGQKQWISFGDHDITDTIGHCLLARSGDQPGGRGLSLFLVPNRRADGSDNGISVIRIEEKLGLHGSPTCALAFEVSEAHLLGTAERGLPQLFTMIAMMRLQTGCQGLGTAVRARDIAEGYAAERRQGGRPDAPPVIIDTHPDVIRQLGVLRGMTGVLRAAVIELALAMDLGHIEPGGDHGDWAAFLLPLVKNFGAETGFQAASAGIQVLGGAGYTQEWPLEQSLRDSRVFAIYEGTTGMQGIDFLERRLVREPAAFEAFMARAKGPLARRLAALGEALRGADAGDRLAVADDWLRAGWLALTEYLAPRLTEDEARPAIAQISERFAVHEAAITARINP